MWIYAVCYRGKIENSESVSKYICLYLKSVWFRFHIEDSGPVIAQDMVPMNLVPTLPAALGIISIQKTFVTYEMSLFPWRSIAGKRVCSCFPILTVWEIFNSFPGLNYLLKFFLCFKFKGRDLFITWFLQHLILSYYIT